MARSSAGSSNKKMVIKETKPKKPCVTCGDPKYLTEYYLSESPLHANDGKIPYCKQCLSLMFDSNNPQESLMDILKKIDKPFFYHIYETSLLESPDNVFGKYMKNIVMPQHRSRGYTWESSIFKPSDNSEEKESLKINSTDDNKSNSNLNTEEQSENITDKWGDGYTSEEYRLFEKKWKKLIDNYGEKTSLHTEGLITYIRFRVREEIATSKGLIKDAKDWASLASTAAKDAKLNVSQLSKSDISGGVELMSQLYEAVESEVGIIPLLPKLLDQPYDDADMVIWSIINYTRRLEDKPAVPYRDIWNFYDEMLQEHFTQLNFNKDQIKEFKENRKNIFRDLSEVYREPLYDGDE